MWEIISWSITCLQIKFLFKCPVGSILSIATWRHDTPSIATWRNGTFSIATWHIATWCHNTLSIATWRHDTLSIATWRHDTLSIATWHHDPLSIATWSHDTLHSYLTSWHSLHTCLITPFCCCHGNILVTIVTGNLAFSPFFDLDLPYTIPGHSREYLSIENSFFITMATVVKVTMPQYFSCYKGPMTHLCAKFHQDQSKIEEKIMSKTTTLTYWLP